MMKLYDDITSNIINNTTQYEGIDLQKLINKVFYEVKKEYEVLNACELRDLIAKTIFILIILGFLNVIHSYIFLNTMILLGENIPSIVNEKHDLYTRLYGDILD